VFPSMKHGFLHMRRKSINLFAGDVSSTMAASTLHLKDWKSAIVLGILASGVSAGLFVHTWYLLPITILTLGAAVILLLASVRFSYFLFLIFAVIAWFPEYSQTETGPYTAKDHPTLYNYPPIPAIPASVFDYLFAAIIMFWVLKYVVPNPRRVLEAPFAGNMLAFLAVWIFNLFHGIVLGNEAYYALREFRAGAYFVITYLMLVTVCGNLQEVRRLMKLSVVIAAVVGFYGVLRYILGMGKEFEDVRLIYYDIADSMLMYIAMLLIASFAIEGILAKKGFVATLLTFPMVFTFLFSYRRGAWIAFSAGMVFLVIFYFRRVSLGRLIFRRVLVPAALIVTLIAAVPALRSKGLDFVATRIQSIFDVNEDPSNVFRILDAMNAFNAFGQHPIVGVGAGGRYEMEFTSEVPGVMGFMETVNNVSHNGYLFVLFKVGIIGFLIYILVFAKFLKSWFQARKMATSPMERAVLMAVGAIVFAFLTNNVTEPVSDSLRPSLLLAFVMSWGAIWMRELNDRAQALSQVPVGQVNSQRA
jgi:O-antigen ligase